MDDVAQVDFIGDGFGDQVDHDMYITRIEHGTNERPRRRSKGAPLDDASALGPPRHVLCTIIAQDPNVREDGKVLRATVNVDADRFRPPFQTHRFNVVSFDPKKMEPGRPLRLLNTKSQFRDRFARATDAQLLASDDFHAQNVFAIASRTLSAFEAALGRRLPWSFEGHQLYLVPHGEIKANAHYSPGNRALVFGVVPRGDGEATYACLSHDIVAHETSHAILDGLRPGYFNASLPDQGAFHEGFADVVALLSVFALPEVLAYGLRQVTSSRVLSSDEVTHQMLEKTVLFGLAEQLGEAVHGREGEPLRQSAGLRPGRWWRKREEFDHPHRRGEVFVAAVTQTLLEMWLGRLQTLLEHGPAPLPLAADQGAKAAQHLLTMLIRAIDYTPPVEFEFEDFVDAVRWSDMQLVPDDRHGYRKSVLNGFARYGIGLPKEYIIDVSKLTRKPAYDRFNFSALRSDRDEVFRFIWENDELLALRLDVPTAVEAIRPSVRVGPDGFVVHETVVTYVQHLDATIQELVDYSQDPKNQYRPVGASETSGPLTAPAGGDPARGVRIFGGGSIIFDQFGRPKFHQHKPIFDWKRQTERLKHLAKGANASSRSRLGAARLGGSEAVAALHRPDHLAAERW